MNDFKRNASHYYDPTAYEALTNIEKERKGHMSMNAKLTRFYRGDIVINETNGKRSFAVVVSNNTINYESPSINIVNITASAKDNVRYPADIALSVPSYAICDRPWNVWKENIVEFVRECTAEEMAAIDKGLRSAFGLDEPQKKADTPILYTNSNVSVSDYEEMKTYIEKLEKTNINLQAENDSVKSENKHLQQQLEKANEDTDHYIEQAAKAEPDIAALTTERDTYKAMYEKLLDKLIGA